MHDVKSLDRYFEFESDSNFMSDPNMEFEFEGDSDEETDTDKENTIEYHIIENAGGPTEQLTRTESASINQLNETIYSH